MKPFVVGDKFAEMRRGSVESVIDAAEALAEAHLEKKVEVIATHPDCIFVVAEGEDCVRKLGIRMEADGPKVISNRVKDGLVTESNLDRHISKSISEAVDALLNGEPCNQLHQAAKLMRSGGRYLFSEERDGLLESGKNPLHWETLYEANRKDIRRMAYGSIREDESKVPKTRYGALPPEKVEGFDHELRSSVGVLLGLAEEVSKELKGVDPQSVDARGWNVKNVLASMQTECSVILDRGNKALSLARREHLADLAEVHDRLADTVKSLQVMRRFIQASTIKGD
jgi:hypothetical protein